MNSEKIRTYDELNVDEQEVLDSFRKMKLMWDQARFELFSYKLKDLLDKYDNLLEMRNETQALLFGVLDEIAAHDLAGIDVDYERIGYRRQVEADGIAEEISLINEYKCAFDEALVLIASGEADKCIITQENSW